MSMQSVPRIGITPNKLVAAVFRDDVSARDAIADLKIAGLHAVDIGVCTSEESRRAQVSADPGGKHSLWWRLRHSGQADLAPRGTSLTNEGYLEKATREDPPYTELELVPTMRSMGVGEETIQLMDQEIGPGGLLIYVSAGHRRSEVELILEKNGGFLRTAMATQPAI